MDSIPCNKMINFALYGTRKTNQLLHSLVFIPNQTKYMEHLNYGGFSGVYNTNYSYQWASLLFISL